MIEWLKRVFKQFQLTLQALGVRFAAFLKSFFKTSPKQRRENRERPSPRVAVTVGEIDSIVSAPGTPPEPSPVVVATPFPSPSPTPIPIAPPPPPPPPPPPRRQRPSPTVKPFPVFPSGAIPDRPPTPSPTPRAPLPPPVSPRAILSEPGLLAELRRITFGQESPVETASNPFTIYDPPRSPIILNHHVTSGDGNCFYYAVLAPRPRVPIRQTPHDTEYWVELGPNQHVRLRERVADYIAHHREDFEGFSDSQGDGDFITTLQTEILTSGEWAGEQAIRAICMFLNRPIVILNAATGAICGRGHLETYLDPAASVPRLREGVAPIFVHYTGAHYSALSVPQGVNPAQVFTRLYTRTLRIEEQFRLTRQAHDLTSPPPATPRVRLG
jgi:hypothetical protein